MDIKIDTFKIKILSMRYIWNEKITSKKIKLNYKLFL